MLSVGYKEGSDSIIIEASFSMLTGADGADTVTVGMKDTKVFKTVGRSADLERKVEFTWDVKLSIFLFRESASSFHF